MIRSPGCAISMASWMEWNVPAVGFTCVGCLPPTVTVTASIDCLPLPAVTTSSPQCAGEPPYWACCCRVHSGTLAGTLTWIWLSDQDVMVAVAPPMVTLESVLHVALPAAGVVHCVPNP